MGKGRLVGKNVAITGTASGQGRAAALMFAAEGACVFGCDLSAERSLATQHLVEAQGGWMHSSTLPVDLSAPVAVETWLDSVASQCERLDVLYNNASRPKFAFIEDMTEQRWNFTLANELTLIYTACRAVWPRFVAQGHGCIVNTASTAGMVAFHDLGNLAHSAAKGGVIAMTRQLAAEGAPHRIRANSISPGFIETEGTQRLTENPEFRSQMLAKHMLPRLGTPMDIAYCALYLASDEASWVTGANFAVDGGQTAW